MNDFVTHLTLDLNCNKETPTIDSAQFDKGRVFSVAITSNGEPFDVSGCQVTLKCIHSDKSSTSLDCTDGISQTGTAVTVTLREDTLPVRGITAAKLVFSDGTRNYSTQIFLIDVDSCLEGNIKQSEPYSVLNRLIDQIIAIKNKIESIFNKKSVITNQPQEGDGDTNYPTVGAVRDFVNLVKNDLEDYVDDEIDSIPGVTVDSGFSQTSTNPVQNKIVTAKFNEVDSKIAAIPTVTVDSDFSLASTNPVQNKIVAAKFNEIVAGKANKANSLSGYGITNAYNKTEVDYALAHKADKSTTLSGYGITDAYTKSEVDSLVDRKAKSAYDIAVDNGYTGTQQEWIASLHAASPTVLPLSVYPNEASAVEYMDSQPDKSIVYVWNNKVYTYCSYSVQGLSGACLYGYRASSSAGIIAGDGKSLFIISVSDFETPLTIDFSGFALSNTPYIYGSTSPTTVTKTLISDDSYVGRTNPITITATQLQNCAYVMFAVTSAGKPASAGVTVNGTAINLNVITSPSEIDSAMDSGSITVTGYVDSGVEYAYPIDGTSGAAYLKTRSTYLPPVPRTYCESKASYEAGSHYLSKYSYSVMTSMFSAIAAAHTDYVTETDLGKDASNTYDIKKYVLNAASSLESGYTSALTNHKPVMIITAGLHGVEPDAVHTVYHFMDDLCNHYMESEELLYLHNNVKFVIVPISNPWGYVNQNYHNSNDVDINKNFEYGYRNNGSANTGTAAYSEAETQILKGVFDEYPEAVFHLECHGKYGEDTAINKTIWFSLMSSLNSELIEICADNLNSKTGMRLKELGYNTGSSTGGYITYYGLNGRPKDYTGSKYGILSATMEGTGKIYGTSGYSVDTQKINTEALENFLLTVLSGFENGL